MPELPEVETSKRYIEQFLLNAKILNIQSSVSKLRWEIHPDINFFFNNTMILKIDRIGKYILINTSNKNTLILHLGMSGYLSIDEVNFNKVKHDHIIINFECITGEKKCLIFNDQRRFGYIDFHYTSQLKQHFLLQHLGVVLLPRALQRIAQVDQHAAEQHRHRQNPGHPLHGPVAEPDRALGVGQQEPVAIHHPQHQALLGNPKQGVPLRNHLLGVRQRLAAQAQILHRGRAVRRAR